MASRWDDISVDVHSQNAKHELSQGEDVNDGRTPREALGASIGALIAALERRTAQLNEARALLKTPAAAGTLSHELRTPLQAIQGYLDLLLSGEYGELNEEQTDVLRRVYTSAESLLDIVNTALELSRPEASRGPLHVEEVQVSELLSEVASETTGAIRKPGLSIVWRTAPNLPPARTDPTKLKLVLKNLVGNAIKFTDKGKVTVDARAASGGLQFRVTDTGAGIAADMRRAIFEPFRQGGLVPGQYGGAGLGLYIVRRLVDRLGGTISLESQIGQGSSFQVWIPKDAGNEAQPLTVADE
jgi:signal transduction histidine kinase